MANPVESTAAAAFAASAAVKYKGVRKRKWGKWVSEVRLPNSRERIWLGSYDSPEKAARAFDAGSFLLRGHRASLNFPDQIQDISMYCSRLNPTSQQIQIAAARYAHADYPAQSQPSEQPVLQPAECSPSPSPSLSPAANHWEYMDQLISPTVMGIHDFSSYDLTNPSEQFAQMDLDAENCYDFVRSSDLWEF
ncbi:ethylene-responsive transcription factor ERF018-like [Phalaenopsis equestris]|uniref:ethylene-responsive transcription factor ERF018-like n=1 Tax=Phalaenopsis equestris TaxID=78828 RepID=UPI0009E45380|nr:ethylene-responsive transcription factor ERF018-like [Phalaenopsis equestris]